MLPPDVPVGGMATIETLGDAAPAGADADPEPETAAAGAAPEAPAAGGASAAGAAPEPPQLPFIVSDGLAVTVGAFSTEAPGLGKTTSWPSTVRQSLATGPRLALNISGKDASRLNSSSELNSSVAL